MKRTHQLGMLRFQSLSAVFGVCRNAASRNWMGGLIGALLSISAGLILGFVQFKSEVPLGRPLIDWSYDLGFVSRPNMRTEGVVIIYMDEDSRNILGQEYEKKPRWDLALHSRLLKRLKEDGASIVVMDVIFSEPTPAAVHRQFSDALRAHGKVVIGANYIQTGFQGEAIGSRVEWPIFREAAACGLVQLMPGLRQHFSGEPEDQADALPSLAWRAAELAGAPVTRKPGQRDRKRWINYYGPPLFLLWVSYHLALKPDGVPPGFFRDKVVFIGDLPPQADLPGAYKEEARTPYSYRSGLFAAKVEVHATTFLNLIRGDWLTRLSDPQEFALIIICGLVVGYGLPLCRPISAAGLALGSGVGATVLALSSAWVARVWLPWLLVVAVQIPMALLWSVLFQSVKLHVEKRVLQRTLDLHLSPQRVKQILKRPDLLRPRAERQEVSILFSDISNFSKVTARLDPDDLFRLLNRYFQASLACIHETDGTVIKLIGDAIFAIWNAPFVQPDQQERACHAAMLLRNRLVEFDSASRSLPLRTRVGLHTGMAYVGNIGSEDRFDYTAIGDPINLASRLEGLNKYLATDVLATREIQKIVEETFLSRKVGYFRFKGLDRVTEVYELIGPRDEIQDDPTYLQVFDQALHDFERKNFRAAEAGFCETLKLRPEDGPALFYLEKIREFQSHPPPDDWTGEIYLESK